MISELSDLEMLIKLEPDSPSKTAKLHLVAEIRDCAINVLKALEKEKGIRQHLHDRCTDLLLENESLRIIVGVTKCSGA